MGPLIFVAIFLVGLPLLPAIFQAIAAFARLKRGKRSLMDQFDDMPPRHTSSAHPGGIKMNDAFRWLKPPATIVRPDGRKALSSTR